MTGTFANATRARCEGCGCRDALGRCLCEYITSPTFRRRARRVAARIRGGEHLNAQQLANAWDVPLAVVLGGFQYWMARQGRVVVPAGIPSPIDPHDLQRVAARVAAAEPKGLA
jgi:hypothetical protein